MLYRVRMRKIGFLKTWEVEWRASRRKVEEGARHGRQEIQPPSYLGLRDIEHGVDVVRALSFPFYFTFANALGRKLQRWGLVFVTFSL